MKPDQTRGPTFWQAIVTVEATAPLTVGTGGGDDLRDSVCVADANGLPTLPGTSLAGALRARWPEATRDDVFGCQRAGDEGHRSRIWFGWAAAHDRHDAPVAFLVADALPGDDPVLTLLREGTTRDHVRISPWGVVDGEGKFDETLVPRGARFSFEIRLDSPAQGEVEILLGILRGDGLRFGGRTRRGFGAVRTVAVRARTFHLGAPAERDAWRVYAGTVDLGARARLLPVVPAGVGAARAPAVPDGWLLATLTLRAEDGWRVGGAEPAGWHPPTSMDKDRDADLVPVVEEAIVWSASGQPSRVRRAYLPGSSIKGALRHRTAYHLRCLRKEWHDDDVGLTAPVGQAYDDGLSRLFGTTRQRRGPTTVGGAVPEEDVAGRVYVEDVALPGGESVETLQKAASYQQHVSLDRFTGAPLAGHLFSEAMLWRTSLEVRVWVDRPGLGRSRGGTEADAELLIEALRRALRDLARGRLPLGAAGSRGHGAFIGSLAGSLVEVTRG